MNTAAITHHHPISFTAAVAAVAAVAAFGVGVVVVHENTTSPSTPGSPTTISHIRDFGPGTNDLRVTGGTVKAGQ